MVTIPVYPLSAHELRPVIRLYSVSAVIPCDNCSQAANNTLEVEGPVSAGKMRKRYLWLCAKCLALLRGLALGISVPGQAEIGSSSTAVSRTTPEVAPDLAKLVIDLLSRFMARR